MLRITYSNRFQKNYSKLQRHEQTQLKNKIKLLSHDPMHPSLRTKRIKGIDDLFETTINMDIRIIWHYEKDDIILLLDVGHHDILKNY